MMYFRDRAEAGKQLAKELEQYKSQNIIVVALDLSSAVVAAQVAMKLHASMALYAIKNIYLPGETEAVAGIGSGDIFTYNSGLSTGQVDEFKMEYHSYIEQQRIEKSHELHALIGDSGEISKDMLRHRTVILVADGLPDGFKLNVAAEYLKTVAIKKLVVCTALASVPAIDRMHLVGDEIHILSTVGNYMGTDHYFDHNIIPDMSGVVNNISFTWDRTATKPDRAA